MAWDGTEDTDAGGRKLMGSMWYFDTNRRSILLGKNYVPNELMTVFRQSDRYENSDLIAEYENLPDHSEWSTKYRRLIGYRTNVKTLRERLHLMGFSLDHIRAEAIRILSEATEDEESVLRDRWMNTARPRIPDMESLLDATIKRLHEVDWVWPYGSEVGDLDKLLEWTWEEIAHEGRDPRFILALQLRGFQGNCSCVLDLTDLAMGGWLDWNEDLVLRASSRLQLETSASGKIIVLTEGSTDAAALQGALRVLRPDVRDYFTFLDFAGFSAPGGTDRVVSLAKGLAAASVMNRVVAVLDNDVAGREAERQLSRAGLPPTFAVMRLPQQDFARKYPTLGPSGSQLENINGRACTIEFMFGEEFLRVANGGALPPVRWKSYLPGMNDCQGVITNKSTIQRAIRELLSSTTEWPRDARRAASSVIDVLLVAARATVLVAT